MEEAAAAVAAAAAAATTDVTNVIAMVAYYDGRYRFAARHQIAVISLFFRRDAIKWPCA